MKEKKDLILNFSFIIYLLFILAGCDEPFEPLQTNDTTPFSIYGYLDATADTQWVRVTPVREQLDMPSEKSAMHVTLEHLQSGNIITMNDSLLRLTQEFYVLNAWTTMDLEPEETYQLTAERPGGATSRVTVTLPKEFPQPTLILYGDGCSAGLQIEGVERLIDVQSKWRIRILYKRQERIIFEEERFYSIPYRHKAYESWANAYSVFINTEEELNQIRNQRLISSGSGVDVEIQVLERELFVASAGPEWNEEFASLDDVVYALPEGVSNVENGLGYMVGVVSASIPFTDCFE